MNDNKGGTSHLIFPLESPTLVPMPVVYVCICVCMYVCMCLCVCMYVCMYVCVYMWVCIYKCMCTYMWVHVTLDACSTMDVLCYIMNLCVIKTKPPLCVSMSVFMCKQASKCTSRPAGGVYLLSCDQNQQSQFDSFAFALESPAS